MLGPYLFLAFINYLPASLTSKARLFADDCLIYRSISSTTDAEALQADLNSLHQWSSKWQMKFNVDKCHTMRITLRRNIIDTKYHLGESTLSMVSEYPYLGLTLTNNLSWQCHIKGITNSANRMLGLIRRNLRSSSRKLRQQAYFTLVRPHLEYCCTVWNPFTTKDIMRVENIQSRAARFVLNNYSVTTMIRHLEWSSLEQRRKKASLLMMYKIHHGLIAINPDNYLIAMPPSATRSYHLSKFQLIPARIQIYKNSFFPRTVTWWNSLPDNILTLPTMEVFKRAVASHI